MSDSKTLAFKDAWDLGKYLDAHGFDGCTVVNGKLHFYKKQAEATKILRDAMRDMTSEQRLELISEIMDGYCRHCGNPEGPEKCQCWNDE